MDISHIIVHLLEKEQYRDEVTITLRPNELGVSPRVELLMDQVRKLYGNKSGRGYGEFGPDKFLSAALNDFVSGKMPFVEFTKLAVSDLASHMETATLASGGHVIFTAYQQGNDEFVMVVMLKSTKGLTFDKELEILDVEHLDLNRLHFAARINLAKWADGEDRYISFIKGRASEITAYFKAFIGVAEYTDARQGTRELVSTIEDFCHAQGMDADATQELKDRVHEYCANKSRAEEPIFLESLSTFIDEDQPEAFLEFANEREVPDEIEVDRRALRSLVKFSGSDSEVSISFKSSAYGRRVSYNLEEDELIIHGVPRTLREQLTSG